MSGITVEILGENCDAQVENNDEEKSWVAVHKLGVPSTIDEDDDDEFKAYVKKLVGALKTEGSKLKNLWEIQIHYKWTPSQPNKLRVRIGSPLFGKLKKLLSFADVRLDFHVYFFASKWNSERKVFLCSVKSECAVEISLLEFGEEETRNFCEEKEVLVGGNVAKLFDKGDQDSSTINATTYLSFEANDQFINFHGTDSNPLKPFCNKMLEQNILTDFTLVAFNGKGFKCHKGVLVVHGAVFKRMLANEFKVCELTLEGVSEECISALLEYIYTLEINKTVSSSTIAVGLFQLAHQYEIFSLEEMLEGMFLLRANDWFDLDPTLELFVFSRKAEHNMHPLKAKLVSVLKSKGNHLMSSQAYKNLFVEDVQAAMELCSVMAITGFDGNDQLINTHRSYSNPLKSFCKKMLEQNIHSDFKIVACNGESLKCHKSFLAANSLVFQTMLEYDFKESKTCELILEDVSEESVAALLEYIYTLEINKAVCSSTVAVELFQLAHMYEIRNPEEILKGMFMQRPNNWFDLESTLELFSFIRKLEHNTDELKAKLFMVLKSKGRDFMSSQVYETLFVEDVLAAMELCTGMAITDFAVTEQFVNFRGSHSKQLKALCKKMLEHNIHTDYIIVASSGKGFQCHKCFLAANSPVFKTMLEIEFQEPKTCEKESEECIAALLEYIYTLEINEAVSSSSAVAVGLFKLAYKYEIFNLAEILEEMLLQSADDWFDLDLTLELFTSSRELNTDELNAKLCSVLEWKGYDFMFIEFLSSVPIPSS